MPKEITNEELAQMIARGFETTASKEDIKRLDAGINRLDGHIDRLDNQMDHLDARMGRMEADLNEIK